MWIPVLVVVLAALTVQVVSRWRLDHIELLMQELAVPRVLNPTRMPGPMALLTTLANLGDTWLW